MKYPAYGKQLMAQRLQGEYPKYGVNVVFEWDLCRYVQRMPRIVLSDAPERLEMRFLAGLEVILVYKQKDAHRALESIPAILDVNPKSLLTFDVDNLKTFFVKTLDGEVMI